MRRLTLTAFLLAFFIGMVIGCQPAPPPYKNEGIKVSPTVAPVVHHLVATSHPVAASIVQSVPAILHAVVSTPPELKPVAHWLDAFIVIGVLVGGGGIGVYFASALLHKLGIALLAIGGSIGALALFVRTTLWMSYWVSGGIALAGIAAILYEIYRNKDLINADVTKGLTPSVDKTKVLFSDAASSIKNSL